MKKFVSNVRNYGLPLAVVGLVGASSANAAIDVSTATAELADAATGAGTVIAAALGVAGILMAGFMLVRRL